MPAALRIANRDARRLWLHTQGLAATPTGALDLAATIARLGFVQLDTIRVVARAHDHILWSRNQNYREPMLDGLLRSRAVFEHFTHDASVLPIAVFPYWRRQFERLERRARQWAQRRGMPDAAARAAIRARIENDGPLSTHAFDTKAAERAVWSRPPHKVALDYMWYAGELATAHRDGFIKYYDLSERVIPAPLRRIDHADEVAVDWLCRAALERLGFASPGDLQRFWDAVSSVEAGAWVHAQRDQLVDVEIETVDGATVAALAPADVEARLAAAPAPTTRLRILNPFDPAVRDRNRLSRLFGFDYRIEIFTPAAQRKFGYYVYPLLEGTRFVGRIEVKAERGAGRLTVLNLWPERGVRFGGERRRKLGAELERLGRFVGCRELSGW